MENQNQELDPQSQEEQADQGRQDRDSHHAGDYCNDEGVIPEKELKGSDADRAYASDVKPANKDMDTDENTGGTAG